MLTKGRQMKLTDKQIETLGEVMSEPSIQEWLFEAGLIDELPEEEEYIKK
jgi:hypothetical protein